MGTGHDETQKNIQSPSCDQGFQEQTFFSVNCFLHWIHLWQAASSTARCHPPLALWRPKSLRIVGVVADQTSPKVASLFFLGGVADHDWRAWLLDVWYLNNPWHQGSKPSTCTMILQMTVVVDLTRSEEELPLVPDYAAGNRHTRRLPSVNMRHKGCRLEEAVGCMACVNQGPFPHRYGEE